MASPTETQPQITRPLPPTDLFVHRHLGPRDEDIAGMLATLGLASLDELTDATVPGAIRLPERLRLGAPRGQQEMLDALRAISEKNVPRRSFLGMGYHGTLMPPVLLRNVLENPGWYTPYTPYQAEISQGRMEVLLAFQTMVSDLTGLPLSNSSLLDEATAAAEAMAMCWNIGRRKRSAFFVADDCHPQTIEVVRTRALPLGIEVEVGRPEEAALESQRYFGLLLQTPGTDGRLVDPSALIEKAHEAGSYVVVSTDLLALTLMTPPGEMGADIAVGSSQRLGIPMGYGGPHAGFLATREEHKRQIPGRVIGVSVDAHGDPAYRLAMQTREQHIRRDKATSNICTAQVLLANLAALYAAWHGPEGLRAIALRIHRLARTLATRLLAGGHSIVHDRYFDTLRVRPGGRGVPALLKAAAEAGINLRDFGDGTLGIALDEPTTEGEIDTLVGLFGGPEGPLADEAESCFEGALQRTTPYLEHPVFHRYHSESEMMRYLHRLQAKDLSLTTSMIPLGSCTMKLNAAAEMLPITWPGFSQLHPFVPTEQATGYREMFDQLERWLAELTGLAAISLQPNAGAQGEYTGLLVIRAYLHDRGERDRNVCLIPVSAHGTNPASAVMAGMRVVTVACDEAGNIDVDDLKAKAAEHADHLAALMITYPSTHGVFEESVREICETVHEYGGQVYMDGANMNAQVGLTHPGEIGADVVHLNLHKTFCIPHGGGGPGMGPIGVASHLAPYLPGHPVVPCGGERAIGPVAAAPYGSPSILPITWMYIGMMGEEGLRKATQVAILNANYMAHRLSEHYDILYTGRNGRVAHEFIMDVRPFKDSAGISVDDVAKRLMDYGFHAPTMSFPVAGTLMVEPTESESREELDRFCDAMIAIREEIRAVEEGRADREDNVLHHAPHTQAIVCADVWDHSYSREQAAFPAPWLREHKYWPAVGRVDNAYGDRHLVCTCPPMEDYTE